MPTKRTLRKNIKRKRRGLATRPTMMTRSLAFKRHNQISTKTFWFKSNGQIDLTADGSLYTQFTPNPYLLTNTRFSAVAALYDQYKVLGYKVRFFPANVGVESHDALLGTSLSLQRGNHIVWSDQRREQTGQVPTAISQIINTASAKMINPRRPYARSIWRPRGKPRWGSTQDIGTQPDDWKPAILHFFQDATIPAPADPPVTLYFWTLQFKVVFRGVVQDA